MKNLFLGIVFLLGLVQNVLAETTVCVVAPILADKTVYFTGNKSAASKTVAFGNGIYRYNSSCVLIKTGCIFAKKAIAIIENPIFADEIWYDSHDTSNVSEECF